MPLAPGTTLGPYEVIAKIGEGGMGEVYRARDTRLDRDVALKVLPEAFTADPDRLARFEREAKVLASLNHPHIGGIHGLEESEPSTHDGAGSGQAVKALVLELVEGPTLADRIAQGPIPVDEALPIARQIAEALETAHEQGVVHRDLKPANVKVKADGTVKVLDFGLAKALETTPAGDPSQSPTLTAAATQIGVIIGTAAYMSPEQARGAEVDRRSDLWALGVVLSEMLTGARLFDGATISDTLAAVLKTEPDWSALPADTPAPTRRLLRRCLDKDARRRVDSASVARLEIDDALTLPAVELAQTAGPERSAGAGRWTGLAVAVVVASALTGLAVWTLTRSPAQSSGGVARLVIPLSGSLSTSLGSTVVALSPDGTRVVFAADGRLYQRGIDELEATPLEGTEGARGPFFSHDGQWVGFWSRGLQKVAISGGPPVPLFRLSSHRGASWEADDTILLPQRGIGIVQVPDGDGEPERLIEMEEGVEATHPQRLPDGEWVLFTVRAAAAGDDGDAQIVAQSIETGVREVIVSRGGAARYLPTGHLVYLANGVLLAAPFDPDTRQVMGDAVPIADDVGVTIDPHFSVADDGTVVYVAGQAVGDDALVWVDRAGQPIDTLVENENIFGYPRLSPDGTRVALNMRGPDVWILDLERGTDTRLTEEGSNMYPIWDVDGAHVTYTATSSSATFDLYTRPADLSGPARPRVVSRGAMAAGAWSSVDGALMFGRSGGETQRDIWVLPEDGDERPFLQTPFNEGGSRRSPDGRWVAYVSDQPGERRIFARPFDGGDQVVPVSTGAGGEVIWSRDGTELFYRDGPRLMVVPVTDPATLTLGTPRVLFEGPFAVDLTGPGRIPNYDVSVDGQRFLMVARDASPDEVIVVLNALEEL